MITTLSILLVWSVALNFILAVKNAGIKAAVARQKKIYEAEAEHLVTKVKTLESSIKEQEQVHRKAIAKAIAAIPKNKDKAVVTTNFTSLLRRSEGN